MLSVGLPYTHMMTNERIYYWSNVSNRGRAWNRECCFGVINYICFYFSVLHTDKKILLQKGKTTTTLSAPKKSCVRTISGVHSRNSVAGDTSDGQHIVTGQVRLCRWLISVISTAHRSHYRCVCSLSLSRTDHHCWRLLKQL